jgi:hypothetical protein
MVKNVIEMEVRSSISGYSQTSASWLALFAAFKNKDIPEANIKNNHDLHLTFFQRIHV